MLKCVLKLNSGNLKLLPSGLVELDDFVDSSGRALPSTVALLQQKPQNKPSGADSEKAVGFFASIWGVEDDEKTAKHLRRNFTCIGARGLWVHVLRSQLDVGLRNSLSDAFEGGVWRAHYYAN